MEIAEYSERYESVLAEADHFAPYNVSTSGRASTIIAPHIGSTTRESARSELTIESRKRSASCRTRENAGIATLFIIVPKRLEGQDATLNANT